MTQSIQLEVTGRLCRRISGSEAGVLFEVKRYEMATGKTVLVRLLDENDILIDNFGSEINTRKVDCDIFFKKFEHINAMDELK